MALTAATELLKQLRTFNADEFARADLPPELCLQLTLAAQETRNKLETPTDTIARIMLIQPAEAAYVRIATELKLYSTFTKDSEPKTLEQLAAATKADPALLVRVLRGLVAMHGLKQTADGLYLLSPAHSLLGVPSLESAYSPCADFMGKVYNSLPPFLSKTNYQNPTNPLDTAATLAFDKPGIPYMSILFQYPDTVAAFATLMNVWADGFNTINTLYPVQEKLITGFDTKISDIMFVDVGGGMGQKSIQFKLANPDLPGRVVVQDLGSTMAGATTTDERYKGTEMQAHDFTTEQPLKGARCYYIRQCLHNWTDEQSVVILKHLRDAAQPGYSRILIHDIIMPERDANQWPVMQDFDMMAMFATKERTERQWRELCGRAGLKVVGVYQDEHPACEGIIETEI